MKRYFLAIVILIVCVLAGFLLFAQLRDGQSVCADSVRGYQQSVESSLAGAAKNLQQVGVVLKGETNKVYADKLSKLQPTDLLALRACDTQCKLLDRCLKMSLTASAAQACPVEYADYKARVDTALKVLAAINEFETTTKKATEQAATVATTQEQLAEAERGAGASGGREALLKQRLAEQTRSLETEIQGIDRLAKSIVTNHVMQ